MLTKVDCTFVEPAALHQSQVTGDDKGKGRKKRALFGMDKENKETKEGSAKSPEVTEMIRTALSNNFAFKALGEAYAKEMKRIEEGVRC